jgi:hypothetical protein
MITRKDINKYATKDEKQFLKEGKIYGSSTAFTRSDVTNISRKCDWAFEDVFDFCLQLLEDVNASKVMAEVEQIFEKETLRFQTEKEEYENRQDSDAQDYRSIQGGD